MFMDKNYGKLRLYANRGTGRLLGAAMCVTGGEHLAHLLAWCIEQELTVLDMQRMPYYHPTLEEGLASAVEDLAGKLDVKSPAPANMTPMSTTVSSSWGHV
jgi:dihydrolipoamide dehydrogenase